MLRSYPSLADPGDAAIVCPASPMRPNSFFFRIHLHQRHSPMRSAPNPSWIRHWPSFNSLPLDATRRPYTACPGGVYTLLMEDSLCLIAVCKYCLVMISIDLSDTAHFVHWKSKTMSETNLFPQIFFSDKKNQIFFSAWILSRTEFCVRSHTAVVFCMQSFNL